MSPPGGLPLEGRTALVTGGARGIGRVTARVLAEAGADVAVIDLAPAEGAAAAVEAAGRRGSWAVADVADAARLAAAIDELEGGLGPPDVVVSAAAITNHIAPILRMAREGWERELAVNLTGTFAVVQRTLPAMVERGWGRIVLISSMAARSGLPRQAAYAASKAGLLGLAKTIVGEHARHGVTCNAVLPGLIETEVVAGMPEEIKAAVVARTPARRLGRMEEVAHVIAWLASDAAGFVNGAEVPVDGGIGLGAISLGSRREVTGPT